MNKESVYFRDGKLISKSGDIRIYDLNNELFMEDGRMNLIASEEDKSEYIWQLGSKPRGDCLVVGLGLCTAARYIISLPSVDSVTVLEQNPDIISAVHQVKEELELFKVIHGDYIPYLYKSNIKYDFIFVDFYNRVNEGTLPYIADVVAACKTCLKPNGIILGWLDIKTAERYIEAFYNLFNVV